MNGNNAQGVTISCLKGINPNENENNTACSEVYLDDKKINKLDDSLIIKLDDNKYKLYKDTTATEEFNACS